MTTLYVSSVDGNDADDGSTRALAKLSVAGALAALTGAGPHFIYVNSAHNFAPAATITWNRAQADQVIAIISADWTSGEPPTTWLAGAKETCGADGDFNIGSSGSQYLFIYGMTVVGHNSGTFGNDINVATATGFDVTVHIDMDTCTLSVPGTNTGNIINLSQSTSHNSGGASSAYRNCTFNTPNSTGSAAAIGLGQSVTLINATIGFAGANKRTVLFSYDFIEGRANIIDSDLSGYNTTSGAYFALGQVYGPIFLINCKLSSTPSLVTGTFPDARSGSLTVINCDSGDTHNVFEYRNRQGTLTENTAIFANNGAQFNGLGISWEIVTTSACSEANPFVAPWCHRWSTATGSQDLHLQLIRDSLTDYTNREVYGEFETLENASFPNGTLSATRNTKPFAGTGVDLTNSSEAWTETLANDNEMECRVTRTLAEKSLIRARLIVGVASTTLYVDPSVRIGSQGANPPTRWSCEGAFNAEPSASGGGGGGLKLVGAGGLAG